MREKDPQQRETIPKAVEPKTVLEQKGTKEHFWCAFSIDRMQPGRAKLF